MTKPNLLLLHGALGCASQLAKLKDFLVTSFDVQTLDFSGHGKKSEMNVSFDMETFANDILQHATSPTHVFGYSMGGYAALVAALQQPQLFLSITTLGTKFDWTPEIAERECSFLNAEKIEAKVPQFAAHLQNMHAPADWKMILQKTAVMMRGLGQSQPLNAEIVKSISIPVQILVGELDHTAGVEFSTHFAKQAQKQFQILPNTPHPIEKVDYSVLVKVLESEILSL